MTLDGQLGRCLVELFVALGAGAVHGRPLAAVEHPELDARRVGEEAHRPAEGVDLADNLPLGDAADGWVAAHLPHGVGVQGQQRCAGAEATRRQRRLDPGVPSADHDDIERIRIELVATHDGRSSKGNGSGRWPRRLLCLVSL